MQALLNALATLLAGYCSREEQSKQIFQKICVENPSWHRFDDFIDWDSTLKEQEHQTERTGHCPLVYVEVTNNSPIRWAKITKNTFNAEDDKQEMSSIVSISFKSDNKQTHQN